MTLWRAMSTPRCFAAASASSDTSTLNATMKPSVEYARSTSLSVMGPVAASRKRRLMVS